MVVLSVVAEEEYIPVGDSEADESEEVGGVGEVADEGGGEVIEKDEAVEGDGGKCEKYEREGGGLDDLGDFAGDFIGAEIENERGEDDKYEANYGADEVERGGSGDIRDEV